MNKKLFTLYWYVLSFLISWGRKRGVHFVTGVSRRATRFDPLSVHRKITMYLIHKHNSLRIDINSDQKG